MQAAALNKKRQIKATNIETGEILYFKSKNQASQYFGCSPALVYCICEGKNNCKTFAKRIAFEYDDSENQVTIIKDPRIKERTPEYYERQRLKRNEHMRKYQAKKRAEKIKLL